MKKRLLITLGCSFTEGEGCYDFTINPKKLHYNDLTPIQRELTFESFHKNGWPNKVGRALNFDKVLNLGASGTANSAHLKLFVDKIVPKIEQLKQEYDIFLIWLMTEPSRFSFYTEDRIESYIPSEAHRRSNNIENAYVKVMKEFTVGPIREQIFLITLSEALFKGHGIHPLYTAWNETAHILFNTHYSPYYITNEKHNLYWKAIGRTEYSGIKGDLHPNEKGYENIANVMVEEIKKSHPHFVGNKPPKEFDWEWDGDKNYVFHIAGEYEVKFNTKE